MVLGQNGLLNNSKETAQIYKNSQEKEELSIILSAYYMSNLEKNEDDLETYLNENNAILKDENDDNYIIEHNGYEFTVNKESLEILDMQRAEVLANYCNGKWTVYDNLDSNNVKIVVKLKYNKGIKEVETPTGVKIDGNEEKEIEFNYNITLGTEESFKVKLSNDKIVSDKILINEDDIYNQIQYRLEKELKIGDYVGTLNMKVQDENEENEQDVQFRVEQIEDRIQLVCQTNVKNLTLKGLDGYNNSETLISEACNNIFTNNSYVLETSSINKGEDYGIGWYTNGQSYVVGQKTATGTSLPYWTNQYFDYSVCDSLLYRKKESIYYYYEYYKGAISGTGSKRSNYTYDYEVTKPICPVITVDKTSINAIGNNQWYIK